MLQLQSIECHRSYLLSKWRKDMSPEMEAAIRDEQLRVYGREFPESIEKMRTCCGTCAPRYLADLQRSQPAILHTRATQPAK